MDKYFEDTSLPSIDDVDATLRSFAMEDSFDDGFAEAVGFESIEDGQLFLRHQLEILGLPNVIQLHEDPDSNQCLSAINVMYAVLMELQAKNTAYGQAQSGKREIQLEMQKLEKELYGCKQKLNKALDTVETWKIKAGSAGRGSEAENRNTKNSASSWQKRAEQAEGSEKKLKSELRRESAEVERLKDALHTALGKPVGTVGRTPVSQRVGNTTPRGGGNRTPRGTKSPSATLSLKRNASPSATPRRAPSPSSTPRRAASPGASSTNRSPGGTARRPPTPPGSAAHEQSAALRMELEALKAEQARTASELEAAAKELEDLREFKHKADAQNPPDGESDSAEIEELRMYMETAEAAKARTAEDHAGELELIKLDMEAVQLSQDHELDELRSFKDRVEEERLNASAEQERLNASAEQEGGHHELEDLKKSVAADEATRGELEQLRRTEQKESNAELEKLRKYKNSAEQAKEGIKAKLENLNSSREKAEKEAEALEMERAQLVTELSGVTEELMELREYRKRASEKLKDLESLDSLIESHKEDEESALREARELTALASDRASSDTQGSMQHQVETMRRESAVEAEKITQLETYKEYAQKMLASAEVEVKSLQDQLRETQDSSGAAEHTKEQMLQEALDELEQKVADYEGKESSESFLVLYEQASKDVERLTSELATERGLNSELRSSKQGIQAVQSALMVREEATAAKEQAQIAERTELTEQQQELETKQESITRQQQQLESEQADSDQRFVTLASKESSLAARESSSGGGKEDITLRRAQIAEREELADKQQELETKQESITSQQAELDERFVTLATKESAFAAQEANLREKEEDITLREQWVDSKQETVAQQMQQVKTPKNQVATRTALRTENAVEELNGLVQELRREKEELLERISSPVNTLLLASEGACASPGGAAAESAPKSPILDSIQQYRSAYSDKGESSANTSDSFGPSSAEKRKTDLKDRLKAEAMARVTAARQKKKAEAQAKMGIK